VKEAREGGTRDNRKKSKIRLLKGRGRVTLLVDESTKKGGKKEREDEEEGELGGWS